MKMPLSLFLACCANVLIMGLAFSVGRMSKKPEQAVIENDQPETIPTETKEYKMYIHDPTHHSGTITTNRKISSDELKRLEK